MNTPGEYEEQVTAEGAGDPLRQQPVKVSHRGHSVQSQYLFQKQVQGKHRGESCEHKQRGALIPQATAQPGGDWHSQEEGNKQQWRIGRNQTKQVVAGRVKAIAHRNR